jgi:type IV secretion system protein VirB1
VIAAALLACAANIAPTTLEAVIQVESRGDPLLVYVNGLGAAQPRHAADAKEATALARAYIAQGYSVDLGLTQVNSRNLAALGYTVEQLLDDPCTIRAGGTVLTTDYAAAVRTHGDGQPALQAALSAYNTGDFHRGFANGYVARYYGPGGIPALTSKVPSVAAAAVKHEAPQPWPNPYTADTTVYVREAMDIEIR